MYYLNEFKRLRDVLCGRRDHLIQELENLPAGELFTYSSHGSKLYCERVPISGNTKKEKRIGVSGNTDRLYQLVRKIYVAKAVRIIDNNIKAVDSLLRRYKPSDENSVMESFITKNPELTAGIYYGITTDTEWAELYREDSSFYKENLTSTSVNGSKRRSLGEIIIGSRLDYYGIPYRYEAPIPHPDLMGSYSPDFTIRRPSDGKIIYWEHLGDVNNEKYMSYSRHKFDEYEKYGIVPWDNLIVSYSQGDYGINEKLIDALIRGWLL